MSSKKKNKRQIVVVNVNVTQVVIVQEQKTKWKIGMLLICFLWFLVCPIIEEVVIRLPVIISLIEFLVNILSV